MAGVGAGVRRSAYAALAAAADACTAPPPCSDILTPLPAFGIPFEIDDDKGPLLDSPIRSSEQLKALHAIDLQQLSFVGESLGLIRREVGGRAATLGFVGCPWTLATYVVEGASSSIYKNIKTMMFTGGWGGPLARLLEAFWAAAAAAAAAAALCVGL